MIGKASRLLLIIVVLCFLLINILHFGMRRGEPIDGMQAKWKLSAEQEELLKSQVMLDDDGDAARRLWEYYYRFEPNGMSESQIDEWASIAARLGNAQCKDYLRRKARPEESGEGKD